ncbi:MAG TPA: peptidyl-prolyl cis-trans isomerase, partial [Gemmatales bacterium]|nr:peptidyl-prolyl cis-trans isomerase [Gemmatales bacterium]
GHGQPPIAPSAPPPPPPFTPPVTPGSALAPSPGAPTAPPAPPTFAPPTPGTPGAPAAPAARPSTGQTGPRVQVAARVLARVNGKPILFEEIANGAAIRLEQIRPQVPEAQWPDVVEQLLRQQLDETINWEVAFQECELRVRPQMIEKVREAAAKEFHRMVRRAREELKFNSDEELRRHFESQGRTMPEMLRQYERYFIGLEYVRNLVRDKLEQITREDLLEYYQAHPEEFDRPELVTWQHIYIDAHRFPSRTEARQYTERLQQQVLAMRTREEFAPLAEQYSHSPDRFDKGEQATPPSQIRPPELQPVVLGLAPMQTGPIVETENGFHIVRMVSYQRGGRAPFAEVCEAIRRKLQERIGMEEFNRLLKEMKAKAVVEYMDPAWYHTGKEEK